MSFLTYQVLALKEFILTAGIMAAVLMVLFLAMAVRPKRGAAHYGIQALFFRQTWKESAYLAADVLQLAFAVSCLVCRTELQTVHILTAGALCLVKLAALPHALSFLSDLLYTAFLILTLLASSLLRGFMGQASFDPWLMAVYWMLQIFILEYAVYDFLHSFQMLLGKDSLERGARRKKERWNRKKRALKELEETYG